ncbi:MAG: GntR family transcriptional regulator [Actinobacteria bacterium]|jgi:DNA-binding transcriptional regulator YhcF (GntR family)|nr:GntR family transcriptional regulator [Actinomycetota bacterium]MCL6105225.1 GntR family transcriptional regulator [Actinomycetota bacterium]
MLIVVDEFSKEPLYSQIAGTIRGAIADGELLPGDRLFPAKQLARDLGVNIHTVLRSYAELKDEGLVKMRPGQGVTVTANQTVKNKSQLEKMVRQLIQQARQYGMSKNQLAEMVNRKW